jgi:hypothetical protein
MADNFNTVLSRAIKQKKPAEKISELASLNFY